MVEPVIITSSGVDENVLISVSRERVLLTDIYRE